MNRRGFFGGLLSWLGGLFGCEHYVYAVAQGRRRGFQSTVLPSLKERCEICGSPANQFGAVCQLREGEPTYGNDGLYRTTRVDQLHFFCARHRPQGRVFPKIPLSAEHWSNNPEEKAKRLALLRAIGVTYAGNLQFDEECVRKIGLVLVVPAAAENTTFDRFEIRQLGS